MTENINCYSKYLERKYSPDQARDERGRFGAGSGAASGNANAAVTASAEEAAPYGDARSTSQVSHEYSKQAERVSLRAQMSDKPEEHTRAAKAHARAAASHEASQALHLGIGGSRSAAGHHEDAIREHRRMEKEHTAAASRSR